MRSTDHRDLRVWNAAVDRVVHVYRITLQWPRTEMFGLTARMRRAAISTASNIAEGQARSSTGDLIRFSRSFADRSPSSTRRSSWRAGSAISPDGDGNDLHAEIEAIARMLRRLEQFLRAARR